MDGARGVNPFGALEQATPSCRAHGVPAARRRGSRDNTIRLIEVAHRQQVAELRGHTNYVHAVAWSPGGARLASASSDFTLRVWDALPARERAKREAEKLTPR